MLKVDIRELKRGPVETDGIIAATDPLFEGLGLGLVEPLRVTGLLEATGGGDYLWRGRFQGRARATCRRCLAEFEVPIESSVDALFSTDPDLADDASVYPLSEPATHVDVTGAVREEVALSTATYPLCREDCRGLCPKCGADLNAGPCGCAAPA